MDFKKLASGAETLFNRAKQFTEEKLGHSEKTEFDPAFQEMLDNADKLKHWTEKIIKDVEAVLQPNQAARMEDFLTEKLQSYKCSHPSEVETLAQTLLDAAVGLGPTTPFGVVLNKCGEAEIEAAVAWKTFTGKVIEEVLLPLNNFLDKDIKAISKERKNLDTKRLDLDVAKGKLKKLTAHGKEADPNTLLKTEEELKAAQADFDKHLETTQTLLEGLATVQDDLVATMKAFHRSQSEYFQACAEVLKKTA